MLLAPYYQETELGLVISREQGSLFAKTLAEDFNPIHDPDSKRFCVPGDLLFALLLSKQGLYQQLDCQFTGMLTGDIPVKLEPNAQGSELIGSQNGKTYLQACYQGEQTQALAPIEHLIAQYVRFSGQTFPHILQPLMQRHGVMIHPVRPLVMYQSMSVRFSRLPEQRPELRLVNSHLDIDGKRGNVSLTFEISEQGALLGTGQKCMILSGLQPYQDADMALLLDGFNRNKQRFTSLQPELSV